MLTKSERAQVLKARGWWALVAITTGERVPRAFGDNLGVFPVVLSVTQDPQYLARKASERQLVHDCDALRTWWGLTEPAMLCVKRRCEAVLTAQGFARVRAGRAAWDVDLGALELCVRAAADIERVTLELGTTVDADLDDAIRRGVAAIAKRGR